MDETESRLVAQIEQAFANTIYPGDDKLINANHCPECEEIALAFQGKLWLQLTDVGFLRYHEAAMSLMYPEGFRFYLPAFLRAALIDPEAADIIHDGLEFHLTPPETEGAEAMEYFLNRVSGFTKNQKQVIKAFLQNSFEYDSLPDWIERVQRRQRTLEFWQTFEG